jgi:nitroimidazol reductase NimA-like FMN-containing flavoprotein (pyridoxamine 5'-phosphate oxidase superfamily)
MLKIIEEVNQANRTRKVILKMTTDEINQFLFCARVGRIGIVLEDGPYIVPVGYGYENNEIFFHSCFSGLKMEGLKKNPNVCFQVDESLSDTSMYKSVIIKGTAKIIDDEEEMIPYLQALINKYRVSVSFDEYISRPGRNKEKENAAIRIVLISPKKICARACMIRVNPERIKS